MPSHRAAQERRTTTDVPFLPSCPPYKICVRERTPSPTPLSSYTPQHLSPKVSTACTQPCSSPSPASSHQRATPTSRNPRTFHLCCTTSLGLSSSEPGALSAHPLPRKLPICTQHLRLLWLCYSHVGFHLQRCGGRELPHHSF